jgi:serine/threonine protein kinase
MADRGIAGPRIAKLGRYEVVSELGKGAMGIVYLAKDPVIGRMVAIKTIRASQGSDDDEDTLEFRERFVREAQTAGILSHPNIVTIHDIGEDPETQVSFIAMEYIEGKNLKQLLGEKTKFPYDQVSEIVAEVAEALDYAHRKGIIHRDVKPANIIITTDGKVKITDFGIAKIASSNLTTTGQFLGTPNYMSPEQVSGSPVDGRTDLFSLGVVLYELLTGRKPFQGDNLTAISYKIVHEDFTPPADLSPDIPVDFNDVVARAMAKDPWNRFQRGKDMALELYQLKARIEEARVEDDLGTMVSAAAEHMTTLKLGNLKELADEGALNARETQEQRPSDGVTVGREGSGSFSKSGSRRPPVSGPPPPVVPPPPPVTPAAGAPLTPRPESGTVPVRPISAKGVPKAAPTTAPRPARKSSARVLMWVAGILVLIAGAYFVMRPRAGTAPPVVVDPGPQGEAVAKARTLEEAKSLYEAGRYEESLVISRTLLDQDPANAQVKELVAQAESAIKARTEQAGQSAQVSAALELARQAFAAKKWEVARDRAGEVLLLDAQNGEATKLRDDATAEIDKAIAEKKKVDAQLAKIRAMPKTPIPQVVQKQEPQGPNPAPAPAGVTTATLRLLFDSPISEGHVMVAVNDQILLRRPYNFKKKSGLFSSSAGTGTVSANIPVPTGPVTVKVWLSGPGVSPAFATATASMLPAETRVLKVDYGGGRLGARVQ